MDLLNLLYVVIVVLSLVVMILAAVSYRRFSPGDFKRLSLWCWLSVFFFVLYKIVEIAVESNFFNVSTFFDEVFFNLLFVLALVFALKAVLEFNAFSNKYSFAGRFKDFGKSPAAPRKRKR